LGELQAASRLATENLEIARAFGAPIPIASGLRCLALASPQSDRIPLLEEALSLLEGRADELDRCLILLDLGRARRERHETSLARVALRAAADVAARMGAVALMDRAADELHASGARPRRLQLHGSDSLTPSERRVVMLAAQGKRNTEIAASLYVSMKTVEGHLARAYRKLGVKSRTELASLFRLGTSIETH
jgi:DNA-binding CsgD family transcriptional regulator